MSAQSVSVGGLAAGVAIAVGTQAYAGVGSTAAASPVQLSLKTAETFSFLAALPASATASKDKAKNAKQSYSYSTSYSSSYSSSSYSTSQGSSGRIISGGTYSTGGGTVYPVPPAPAVFVESGGVTSGGVASVGCGTGGAPLAAVAGLALGAAGFVRRRRPVR